MKKLSPGTKVRFAVNNLGGLAALRYEGRFERHNALGPEDLRYDEPGAVFQAGATGTVVFAHPNKKLCREWWFVEVLGARPYYVGVTATMVEVL